VDIHEAILHQAPVPARVRNPRVPRGMDAVISKVLEKDREQRCQSVAEHRKDLSRIARETNPAIRYVGRMATAVVLLALVALAIWRYEVSRHRITLAPTDTIVLGDVDNRAGDPIFDDALNIALRYEMQQTPYLNILGMDKAYATLAQLKLPPTTKITPDVARQICGRTNSKMVISQSIDDAGNGYHLEMSALDCGSGATLRREQADIGSRNEVIHELGVTAVRLRAKLGEPSDSIARFNQPLEKALSASLEALQAGTEGTKLHLAGDFAGAVKLYEQAVELDPNLALTYEGMGAAYLVLGNTELSEASNTRAYQLRDRLTERDRLNTEINYYGSGTGQWERCYSSSLQYLELFPRDVFGHNNLGAGLLHLGQLERAADEVSETARLDPSPYYFQNAVSANMTASRFNEAKSWLKKADELNFDSLVLHIRRLDLAYIEGDQITINRIFRKEEHSPDAAPFLSELSRWATFQGRFHSADRLALQAQTLPGTLPYLALSDGETGRLAKAHKIAEILLRLKLNRGAQMVLALALARSGKTEQAGKIADEVSAAAPLDTVVQYYLVPTVRAAIKLQQHDPGAAIEFLRATTKYELSNNDESFDYLYPAYVRGQAFLALGDARSAAVEFQKLIDHPGLTLYHVTGPLAWLQLGRAQKMMGDEVAGRKSYEKFLSLWKDADPDVPIYRKAKAEYAELKKM
jgi:eukaryotic-like serine/threonine-protein kinase